MKKFLLLALGAFTMTLGSLSASAYTAQEIAAKGFAWRAVGDAPDAFNQETVKIPYFLDGEVKLSVDSDGDLVVSKSFPQDLYTEFGTNEVEFKITISGTKAYVNNGTFTLRVYAGLGGDYDSYGRYGLLCNEFQFTRLWGDGTNFIGIFPLRSNDIPYDGPLTGTVSKDADGNFVITFPKFELHKLQAKRGNIHVFSSDGNSYLGYGANFQYFNDITGQAYGIGSLEFHTYTPNVTISEKVWAPNQNDEYELYGEDTYGAYMKMTDANNFYIDNWHNMGRGYKVVVPSGAVSRYNPLDKKYVKFTGSIDRNDLTITIKNDDVFGNFWLKNNRGQYYYDASGEFFLRNMGTDFQVKEGEWWCDDIVGYIEGDEITHRGTNTWLNKLDNVTVLTNPTAYFDEYEFRDVLYNDCRKAERVTDIVLPLTPVLGSEIEYTHDCALEIQNHGYGLLDGDAEKGNHLYIQGVIQQLKNNAFVDADAYDIYVLPAKDAYKFDDPEFFHEDGHSEATLISKPEYYYHWVPKAKDETTQAKVAAADKASQAAELNSGLNFCLMVPESDLNVKAEDGKYAYYIRAKYNQPASRALGLTDSFHGLTTPTGDGMTAVDDVIVGDNEGTVAVNGTDITISDSEGNALICTVAGVVVYQGGDATISVEPGMYIVRAGKTAQRVIVK